MLYQQARPKTFEEVIGNEGAVKSLQKELQSDNHAHVFLFYGPSGCGKTTLARIAADVVGCSDMNINELNASKDRGIDTIRLLEEMVPFAPMGGGSRAVILDECHMLTKEAQNASLKLLEDIPSYQYFFLCTTDPRKLINTIRTRCNQVQVLPIVKDKDMSELIDQACTRLSMEALADDVVWAIVDAADGCPRTALVLLEKVAELPVEEAKKAIQQYKGPTEQVIDLCKILLKGSWQDLTKIYDGILKQEIDIETIRRSALGYLHTCLLRSTGDKAEMFFSMIDALKEPTFNSGKAGLLAMLWQAKKYINSSSNSRQR